MQNEMESLLSNATCCVRTRKSVGTGWLASYADALVVSAGHLVKDEEVCKVSFPNGDEYDATIADWKHDPLTNTDFSILRVRHLNTPIDPIPGVCVPRVRGAFHAYGYGRVLDAQSLSVGTILGSIADEKQRLFKLDSKHLGSGFSGAAIYSTHLHAVVAIQSESTLPDSGPERDTHLAMPLARIAEACRDSVPELERIWPDFYGLVRERIHRWQMNRASSLAREGFGLRTKVIPPPLYYHWEDFLLQSSWRSQMESHVNDIQRIACDIGHECKDSPEFTSIAENAKQINWKERYDDLNTALGSFASQTIDDALRTINYLRRYPTLDATLLEKICELHRRLFELKERTRRPQFNRCFCVMGPLGSGRTHFVHSLFTGESLELSKSLKTRSDSVESDSLRATYEKTLMLAPVVGSAETVQDAILRNLRDATCLDDITVADIDQLLTEVGNDSQLVIVIDDLHELISTSTSGGALTQLLELIKDYTVFSNVYWLLTLNTTEYYLVAARYNDWMHFAFQVSEHRKRPMETAAGWIPLELLNRNEQLGLKILRRHYGLTDSIGRGPGNTVPEELLPEIGSDCALARSPMLAWLLVELRDRLPLPLESVIDMRFLQVVITIATYRLAHAALEAERRGVLSRLTKPQMIQTIHLLTSLLFMRDSRGREYGDLITSLVQASRDTGFGIRDEDDAKRTLELLCNAGFLQIHEETGNLGVPEVNVSVALEVFWECVTAIQFLDINRQTIKTGDPARLVGKLRQWIRDRSDQRAEGVVEFVLLVLDLLFASETQSAAVDQLSTPEQTDVINFYSLLKSTINRPSFGEFARGCWVACLGTPGLSTAAVYFAASKSSVPIQHVVIDPGQAVGSSSDARTLFSYLYFMTEGEYTVDLSVAIGLVRKLFGSIKRASLHEYFVYFASRQMARIGTADELIRCLYPLIGCEILTVQEKLAETAAQSIKRLIPDARERLSVFVEFLSDTEAQAVHLAKRRRRERDVTSNQCDAGWRRFWFREWLIHFTCMSIVEYAAVDDAYDLFCACEWYTPKTRWSIGKVSAIQMEREANIALGSLYTRYKNMPAVHDDDEDSFHVESGQYFVEFVDELSRSSSAIDRHNAFHIIRHTVRTDGRLGVRVDDVFRPALHEIRSNEKLYGKLHRFRDMFELNL